MSRPKISSTPSHTEVQAVFKRYAMLYARMERLQHPRIAVGETERLLPTGDQKTGCIGEYWAMRYARKRWPKQKCIFGSHSQHGWDIAIQETKKRIQVKTVSAWSKKRGLSPIHRPDYKPRNAPSDWAPWTDLWLIYLNEKLTPTGFWRIKSNQVVFGERDKLDGLRIRQPDNDSSGSKCLTWPENTVSELLCPLITAH